MKISRHLEITFPLVSETSTILLCLSVPLFFFIRGFSELDVVDIVGVAQRPCPGPPR